MTIKKRTFADFKKDVQTLTVSLLGMQKQVQLLTVEAIAHAFNNKMDTSYIRHLVGSLENVGGSFRLESLIIYIQDFAGVTIKPDHDKGHGVIVKKDTDWKGSRGKKQLEKLRATIWFQYKTVDVFKTPVMNAQGLVTVAARGLATGDITEQDVVTMVNGLIDEINAKVRDEKVQSWAASYLKQELKKVS